MFKPENMILTLIDVQQKLTDVMHGRQELIANLVKLVKGLQVLQIPIIWVEQLPEKMGSTIPELAELMPDLTPIEKSSFSCYGCEEYRQALKKTKRDHVLIAGIETHVCVYQTAVELIHNSHTVEIITDATSSRSIQNKQAALGKIIHHAVSGMASCTTTEMLLFEILGSAQHPCFKDILKIVK